VRLQTCQQVFRLDSGEPYIQITWMPVRQTWAVQDKPVVHRAQRVPQFPGRCTEGVPLCGLPGKLGGGAHTYTKRNCERSRTQPVLLPASEYDGRQVSLYLALYVEAAYSLGSIHFVAGQTHHFGLPCDHSDIDCQRHLRTVHMHMNTKLRSKAANLLDALDRTDFAVDPADGNQKHLI